MNMNSNSNNIKPPSIRLTLSAKELAFLTRLLKTASISGGSEIALVHRLGIKLAKAGISAGIAPSFSSFGMTESENDREDEGEENNMPALSSNQLRANNLLLASIKGEVISDEDSEWYYHETDNRL